MFVPEVGVIIPNRVTHAFPEECEEACVCVPLFRSHGPADYKKTCIMLFRFDTLFPHSATTQCLNGIVFAVFSFPFGVRLVADRFVVHSPQYT